MCGPRWHIHRDALSKGSCHIIIFKKNSCTYIFLGETLMLNWSSLACFDAVFLTFFLAFSSCGDTSDSPSDLSFNLLLVTVDL